MDKADKVVQVMDTKIHALTALRLATFDLLPVDLAFLAEELEMEIGQVAKEVGEHLDLSGVLASATAFKQVAAAFEEAKSSMDADVANRKVLQAVRLLTEINYTIGSKFEHDAAVPAKPIPALQGATKLTALDPESLDYLFLQTKMNRERNRLAFAFVQAARALA